MVSTDVRKEWRRLQFRGHSVLDEALLGSVLCPDEPPCTAHDIRIHITCKLPGADSSQVIKGSLIVGGHEQFGRTEGDGHKAVRLFEIEKFDRPVGRE